MRIKRVSCDQFAGLIDKEVKFEKGLNLVIGANESGKSTMVDLIYQLFFKDIKLDGRTDSDFFDRYFPKKVSGPQGDVIDGSLVFETTNGQYKIKKEWEKGEGSARLTLPDGSSIKGNAAIKELLGTELKAGAGVYNEIIFASQKRNQLAVASIMEKLGKRGDALSDTRESLASTLTRAALETGGVSLEKIEKRLRNILDEMSGRWDFAADAPEGGARRSSYRNAWANGAGSIVKAYYAADEIKARQIEAENAEKALEKQKVAAGLLETQLLDAKQKRDAFLQIRETIGQATLLKNTIESLEARIREERQAAYRWPQLISDMEKGSSLKKKRSLAAIHELYIKAESVWQKYQKNEMELGRAKEIDPDDIRQLKKLEIERQTEQGKLSGMNISARIEKLGDRDIAISSISSGELLSGMEENFDISEAVEISVPGVIRLQLLPKGVNPEEIKSEIDKLTGKIDDIHEKYQVTSLEQLESLSLMYEELKKKGEKLKADLEMLLGGQSYEELKNAHQAVPDGIEAVKDIDTLIGSLCGGKNIDAYLGGLESNIDIFIEKYGSMANLKESISNLETEVKKKQEKCLKLDSIPEEFQEIEDTDAYYQELKDTIEGYEEEIATYHTKMSELEHNLGEKSAEEYSEELLVKQAEWEAKKAEYKHWENINNKFLEIKEKSVGNPIEDIADRFNGYLQLITENGLKLTDMDADMTVNLASGNNALKYNILSEGSRDTISLAFRLTMLEHLFPEGDGLAVFDDPFTDMDPGRAAKACSLIQKFAENNQVIFITCDEKYKDLLSGEVVTIG